MLSDALKSISTILNVVHSSLALVLAAVSIWYFIELKGLTDLRDQDLNVLNFDIYWPQIVPWMFLTVSLVVICVNACGLHGIFARKRSSLYVFVTFLALVTLAAFGAGIVGLTCAISKESDDFIHRTVSDAHTQVTIRSNVATAYKDMERRFRCCGVKDHTDYNFADIPDSCCDRNDLISNEQCSAIAKKRSGCAEVAQTYMKMFIRYSSIGSIGLALIGVGSVIVAVLLVLTSRNKSEKYRSEAETEPLKVPL